MDSIKLRSDVVRSSSSQHPEVRSNWPRLVVGLSEDKKRNLGVAIEDLRGLVSGILIEDLKMPMRRALSRYVGINRETDLFNENGK